jgi:hypothetical protein
MAGWAAEDGREAADAFIGLLLLPRAAAAAATAGWAAEDGREAADAFIELLLLLRAAAAAATGGGGAETVFAAEAPALGGGLCP